MPGGGRGGMLLLLLLPVKPCVGGCNPGGGDGLGGGDGPGTTRGDSFMGEGLLPCTISL